MRYSDPYTPATTLSLASSRQLVMPMMCKRVDALCGKRDDEEIAARFGVEISVVYAMRYGIGLDHIGSDNGDAVLLVARLAQETGASADWLLGRTDVVARTPRVQQVTPRVPRRAAEMTLHDKLTLLSLLVASIILELVILLFAMFPGGL